MWGFSSCRQWAFLCGLGSREQLHVQIGEGSRVPSQRTGRQLWQAALRAGFGKDTVVRIFMNIKLGHPHLVPCPGPLMSLQWRCQRKLVEGGCRQASLAQETDRWGLPPKLCEETLLTWPKFPHPGHQ